MSNIFFDRYKKWGYEQDNRFRPRSSIRINTSLIKPSKLVSRLVEKGVQLEKVPFLDEGYYYEADFPIASSIEYLLGYFYIQEVPAQIPVLIMKELIKDKKFDDLKILDMCAAPGGKTTYISQILRNKGTVLACDSSTERIEKLCFNLERMRTENCDVLKCDASSYKFKDKFDLILVDAPCSGNFIQDKDWLERRKLDDFKDRQRIQKDLVLSAISHLKEGGYLIYSTCSLEMEENEEVVEFALSKGLKLQPISLSIGSPGLTKKTENCIRFWPKQDKQPGFFISLLRK